MYTNYRSEQQDRRESCYGHPQRAKNACGLAEFNLLIDSHQRQIAGSGNGIYAFRLGEGSENRQLPLFSKFVTLVDSIHAPEFITLPAPNSVTQAATGTTSDGFVLTNNPGAATPISRPDANGALTLVINEYESDSFANRFDAAAHFVYIYDSVDSAGRRTYRCTDNSFIFTRRKMTSVDTITIAFLDPDIPAQFPENLYQFATIQSDGVGKITVNTATAHNLAPGDLVELRDINVTGLVSSAEGYLQQHATLYCGASTTGTVIDFDPSLATGTINTTFGTATVYIPKNRFVFRLRFRGASEASSNGILSTT